MGRGKITYGKNDYKRLKDNASMEQVVSALGGLGGHWVGSSYFMGCPHPDHNDSHPSCYFKHGWNNCLCKSCGRSMQAIDVIMYTRGCGYGEAADFLWELEGCPEWYKAGRGEVNLSGNELQAIGVREPYYVYVPAAYTETKETLSSGERYDQREIDGYLKMKQVRISWKDFFTKEEYQDFLKRKAKERLASLRDGEKAIGGCFKETEDVRLVYGKLCPP